MEFTTPAWLVISLLSFLAWQLNMRSNLELTCTIPEESVKDDIIIDLGNGGFQVVMFGEKGKELV